MEKLHYRETIAYLNELFEGKQLLNVSDVSRKMKIDRRAAIKRFPFKNNKIELPRLASYMCLSAQDVRKAYYN